MAADPYPRRLREHLQGSLADGIVFKEAWARATRDVPTPPASKPEDEWPIRWMRHVFELAYNGRLNGPDVTALMEDAPVAKVIGQRDRVRSSLAAGVKDERRLNGSH